MNEKIFHKHKNSNDPNNPYDEFIKRASQRTKVRDCLRTSREYIGHSSIGIKGENHHFLDQSLFPKSRTPVVKVSQKKHIELQTLLAKAKSLPDYLEYESELKKECPQISESVSVIYWERIGELKENIVWKLKRILSEKTAPIFEWLRRRRKRKTTAAKEHKKYLRRKAKRKTP